MRILYEKDRKTNFETTIYGHRYEVYYEIQYKTLYLTDVTEISKIKENYEKRITAIGYINVDNLENTILSCSKTNAIDSAINLILIEEMPAYFCGQKELSEVVVIVQDRAQKVLDERS